ncbi:hypothetical protein F01_210227 [Burkholderia cenocepacia]|nr:hypothetical protein F01_210227 [Burkholderia cenocepacia]
MRSPDQRDPRRGVPATLRRFLDRLERPHAAHAGPRPRFGHGAAGRRLRRTRPGRQVPAEAGDRYLPQDGQVRRDLRPGPVRSPGLRAMADGRRHRVDLAEPRHDHRYVAGARRQPQVTSRDATSAKGRSAALSLKAKCKVRAINTPVSTGVFFFVGTRRAVPSVPTASHSCERNEYSEHRGRFSGDHNDVGASVLVGRGRCADRGRIADRYVLSADDRARLSRRRAVATGRFRAARAVRRGGRGRDRRDDRAAPLGARSQAEARHVDESRRQSRYWLDRHGRRVA